MNYQLHESEFYALQSVLGQLNLLAGVLACVGKSNADFQHLVMPDDLYEYLNAQAECIRRTTDSIHRRYEAQKESGLLAWFDLIDMLRIARGDLNCTPSAAESRIMAKLQTAAVVDTDMQPVLNEWLATLATLGKATTKPPRKPRKKGQQRQQPAATTALKQACAAIPGGAA